MLIIRCGSSRARKWPAVPLHQTKGPKRQDLSDQALGLRLSPEETRLMGLLPKRTLHHPQEVVRVALHAASEKTNLLVPAGQ